MSGAVDQVCRDELGDEEIDVSTDSGWHCGGGEENECQCNELENDAYDGPQAFAKLRRE